MCQVICINGECDTHAENKCFEVCKLKSRPNENGETGMRECQDLCDEEDVGEVACKLVSIVP